MGTLLPNCYSVTGYALELRYQIPKKPCRATRLTVVSKAAVKFILAEDLRKG